MAVPVRGHLPIEFARVGRCAGNLSSRVAGARIPLFSHHAAISLQLGIQAPLLRQYLQDLPVEPEFITFHKRIMPEDVDRPVILFDGLEEALRLIPGLLHG